MEFKAEQKYMLISPRKVRPVVALIKKMTPAKAILVLPFIKKRSSEVLTKVIKSAVANAGAKNIDIKDLVFKEIQVGEGPRLKRGQPVSRGRWHPIKKRMSHIKVILKTNDQLANNNLQTTTNNDQKDGKVKGSGKKMKVDNNKKTAKTTKTLKKTDKKGDK